MKDIKYIIADNVRFYRKKADLTQAGLAERAELSLDTIKRIEAGTRTMSLENFLGLSDALRIPLTFLLYEQKDRMPDEERTRGILKGRSDGWNRPVSIKGFTCEAYNVYNQDGLRHHA